MLAFSWMSSLTFAVMLALFSHPAACQGRSLSRSQRQAVTSELATGLTGTGTSFNSLYNDPYTQQNVLNQPYDEYGAGYGLAGGRVGGLTGLNGYAGGKYPGATTGYANNYGSLGYDPLTSTYGGTYGGAYGSGLNGGVTAGAGWNGFGLGKGYGGINRGRGYSATSGVKY